MNTKIQSTSDSLYKLLTTKSFYHSQFGKSSPTSGRHSRRLLFAVLLSQAGLYPVLSNYNSGWLFNGPYILGMLLVIFLLKKQIEIVNAIATAGFSNARDRYLKEVSDLLKKKRLNLADFEILKNYLKERSSEKHYVNLFSEASFLAILSILVAILIALYSSSQASNDALELVISFIIFLFPFWYLCRIVQSDVVNIKPKRYYELFCLLSTYSKEDLK